jgi:hypothetical protein
MELNYRHSKVQFQAASYILKTSQFLKRIKLNAFSNLVTSAKMDHL